MFPDSDVSCAVVKRFVLFFVYVYIYIYINTYVYLYLCAVGHPILIPWFTAVYDVRIWGRRFERRCLFAVIYGFSACGNNSTGSQKTGKCASSTLTRLTQNWPPKFQANKCGSQTMQSRTMRKEAFPNISKQFHLLLNLFDVHAFRLHHLPVRYAIFL